MKKILIAGAGSYIGTSIENYLKTWSGEYVTKVVDLKDASWRELSFSSYDAVFHVAGIAHQKETRENAELYYEVNRDLAVDVAKKAKADGVRQFIFLSSMSVYGVETGVITKKTVPNPKSNYGKSKLQAEELLRDLQENCFKVAILRPPMVYGKDCKGNFQSVIKLVRKLPVFPKVDNKRSMIYIDNLSSFVKMCIDDELDGLFFPQNEEYVNTCKMASVIADSIGKKLYMSLLLGVCVKLCSPFVGVCRKAFGSLIYSDTDDALFSYCVAGTEESISKSV